MSEAKIVKNPFILGKDLSNEPHYFYIFVRACVGLAAKTSFFNAWVSTLIRMNNNGTIKIAPSGLMDLNSAGQYLGVSMTTIRWLRRMKKLPFVILGGKLYVKQHDLDAYIEAATEPAINS